MMYFLIPYVFLRKITGYIDLLKKYIPIYILQKITTYINNLHAHTAMYIYYVFKNSVTEKSPKCL